MLDTNPYLIEKPRYDVQSLQDRKPFDKRVKKLFRGEQNQITHIENQLKINPFVGKSLGYRFFREKKIGGKRIYYLVYEDMVICHSSAGSSER